MTLASLDFEQLPYRTVEWIVVQMCYTYGVRGASRTCRVAYRGHSIPDCLDGPAMQSTAQHIILLYSSSVQVIRAPGRAGIFLGTAIVRRNYCIVLVLYVISEQSIVLTCLLL